MQGALSGYHLVYLADQQNLICKTSIVASFKVPESSGIGITHLVPDYLSIYIESDARSIQSVINLVSTATHAKSRDIRRK